MSATGIVISSRNRAHYLADTLDDLRRSMLPDASVMLVDDGSTQRTAAALLRDFVLPDVTVRRLHRPAPRGSGVQGICERWLWSRVPLRGPVSRHRAWLATLPWIGVAFDRDRFFTVHDALREGIDALLAADPSVRTLVILDAEMRLHPMWLVQLRALFERERPTRGPLIATAFHTPHHAVLEEHADLRVKASLGGCNMMFDVPLYHEVIRPNLRRGWDWCVVQQMRERGYPMLCTRPSFVQHVGVRGVFSNPGAVDQAPDFLCDAR